MNHLKLGGNAGKNFLRIWRTSESCMHALGQVVCSENIGKDPKLPPLLIPKLNTSSLAECGRSALTQSQSKKAGGSVLGFVVFVLFLVPGI